MAPLSTKDPLILPPLPAAALAEVAARVLAIAAEVRASPAAQSVGDAVWRSSARLKVATQALADALRLQRGSAQALPEAQQLVIVDEMLDRTWAAFRAWIASWTRLEDDGAPSCDAVRAIHDRLFPDGLAFIRAAYPTEWQESDWRLKMLVAEGHMATIEALGGGRFVTHLRELTDTYGGLVGTTAAVATRPSAMLVRPQREAALVALRDYATKAAALADPEIPGSADLARRLLAPITELSAAAEVAPPAADGADAPR